MKRILIAALATMFLAPAAFAGQVRDNCGCGLGVVALGDEDGLVSQIVALTLNGLCWNQAFAMSSGTLECSKPTTLAQNNAVREFVGDHMDHLVADIASGQGESLDAFADLLQVDGDARVEMFDRLQSNFDRIFSSSDLTVDQVLDNLQAVI